MQPHPALQHTVLLETVTLVLGVVFGVLGALVLAVAWVRFRRGARGRRGWLVAVDLCGAGLFCALAHLVTAGTTASFDRTLELAVHRFDTPALDLCARFFTDLGSVPGLSILVALIALLLLVLHRRRAAAGLVTVAVLSALLVEGLKNAFARVRPSLFTEIAPLHSFSFPSGHSLASSAVFGTLAVIVARARPRLSPVAFGVAALLALSIGMSRIYLGVHWPSDVLAGFLLGSLVALNAAVWLTRELPAR